MHELSLAEAMIEQLTLILDQEEGQHTKIERIDLEIGAMSGVEQEPFEFVFPIVAKGTVAEGAVLYFKKVPVEVLCEKCHAVSCPEFPMIVCKTCSSTNVEVIRGKDFKITSMEVS